MPKKKIEESRRNFLIKSLSVVPSLALTGIAAQAMAASSSKKAKPSKKAIKGAREYQPSFFNQDEFAFIKAAVARLIPEDNLGPGALAAGVPEFIDRQMQTPYGVAANWYMQGPFQADAAPTLGYQLSLKPQEIYRLGIADANAFAREKHGDIFHKLSGKQQDSLLEQMESGKAEFSKLPSAVFFSFLLQNTREGFFSDPVHGGNQGLIGWKLIGFPGARADFMDWVERNEKYPFPPVSISGERG